MPSIKALTQASGYIAAYAGQNKKEDQVEHVICWSVIEFDEGEPDEVVGQIFDGQCVTEATSVDQEEGYGEFVGYYRDTEKGREEADEACARYRERLKGIKKASEDAVDDDSEEDDPEEEGAEDAEEDADEEEDDFSSWDD